jgi:hypothetical protein
MPKSLAAELKTSLADALFRTQAVVDCTWCKQRHSGRYLCDAARRVLDAAPEVADQLALWHDTARVLQQHVDADHEALRRVWLVAQRFDDTLFDLRFTAASVARRIREAVIGS